MKIKIMIVMFVLSICALTLGNLVVADEKGSHKGSMADGNIKAKVAESGAIKIGNTICPIGKGKVGEMGEIVEYEHEGKIYNLCCKMCARDFKKDPEKYIKMINESMAKEASEVSADTE